MNVQDVMKAVDEFFGDRSRPAHETRDGLEEISAHVESMIDSLDAED